jgi:hypothetical protein
MEQLMNRHTTADFCMADLAHEFAMRRVVREGRKAYKRGTVPLCPYPLIHDDRSTAWMMGWTDRMIEDDIANSEFSSTEYLFWPADGINYNLRVAP